MKETKPISKKVTRSVKKRVPESVPKKAPTRRVLVVEPKKVTTKKVVAKKVAEKRSRTKTTETVTIPTKKKPVPTDEVVLIPGTISQRLAEKMKVYEIWCRDVAPRYVEPLSTISGYTFVVVGLLAAYFSWVPFDTTRSQLLANLPCVGTSCPDSTVTDTQTGMVENTNTNTVTMQAPLIRFSENIQIVPNQDTEVTVTVDHSSSHTVMVVSPQLGFSKRLEQVIRREGNSFTYRLPVRDLLSGQYLLQAMAVALDGSTKTKFNGPTFTVPERPLQTSPTSPITPSSPTAEVNSDESTIATTSTQGTTPKSPSSEVITSEDDTTSDPKEVIEAPSPVVEVPPALIPLAMRLDQANQQNRYRISLRTDYDYARIEIYARPSQSTSFMFLGIATKLDGEWIYWLDGSALPLKSYTLQARAFDEGQVKAKSEVIFHNRAVEPKLTDTATSSTPVIKTVPKSIEAPLVPPEVPIVPKPDAQKPEPASSTRSTVVAAPVVQPELRTIVETDRYVRDEQSPFYEERDELNQLLERYGSAMQAGDESMIRLAETRLDEKVKSIISNSGSSTPDVVPTDRLASELAALKNRVLETNELLVTRAEVDTVIDSDKDGVSDFDEVSLYFTDPQNPDTDQDGFIDGVEIMLGYDPTNPSAEAIVEYRSPKDVSYVSDMSLRVKSIAPVLEYESEGDSPVVYSEISGYGLPNSFVTLFIYSEPTIVTIRTNTDGSFSYVFTKELEDGAHEVYVALTDNTGDIVVRSNPLRFVKTAQAFTYVDEAGLPAVTAVSDSEDRLFRAYNLVGAVGIVSFGLILLLLGFTVRARRPSIVEITV